MIKHSIIYFIYTLPVLPKFLFIGDDILFGDFTLFNGDDDGDENDDENDELSSFKSFIRFLPYLGVC